MQEAATELMITALFSRWFGLFTAFLISCELFASFPDPHRDTFPYPTDDTFSHIWSPQARNSGVVSKRQYTDLNPPPSMMPALVVEPETKRLPSPITFRVKIRRKKAVKTAVHEEKSVPAAAAAAAAEE